MIQPLKWPATKPAVPPNGHGWLVEGTKNMLDKHLGPDTKLIVELGVWLGKSTRYFLDTCPQAKVISVDLWDEKHLVQWAEGRHAHLVEVASHPVETFMVNLWEHRDRVEAYQCDSITAIKTLGLRGLKPDIIYLDTSHLYPETLHEIEAIKQVFPDVPLVGDDWLWPNSAGVLAVQRSVHEYLQEHLECDVEADGNGWRLVPAPLDVWYNRKVKALMGEGAPNWAISMHQGEVACQVLDQRRAKVVVELGAGLSTLIFHEWAARTGATVFTTDTDDRWLQWVAGLLVEKGLPTDKLLSMAAMKARIKPGMADVVFIDHGTDGDHGTRLRDMPWTIEMVGDDGLLLLDDWGKRYAARMQSMLQRRGWEAVPFPTCRMAAAEKVKAPGGEPEGPSAGSLLDDGAPPADDGR